MNLRNPEAYIDAIWDWGTLRGCFGDTKIRPSDIDGAVERYGHILWMERKPVGMGVDTGQALLFDAVVMKGDHVLVFWTEGREVKAISRWPNPRRMANLDDFRNDVAAWFRWADGHPLVRIA